MVSPADGICFSERGYTAVLRKRGRGSCVWTDSDGAFGGRSQGEKVSLACILSLNPEVLILDEPLAGLDEKTQDMLLDFLKNFHNAGKTLITITHNRQLAENLGTRFAVMNEEHELKVL